MWPLPHSTGSDKYLLLLPLARAFKAFGARLLLCPVISGYSYVPPEEPEHTASINYHRSSKLGCSFGLAFMTTMLESGVTHVHHTACWCSTSLQTIHFSRNGGDHYAIPLQRRFEHRVCAQRALWQACQSWPPAAGLFLCLGLLSCARLGSRGHAVSGYCSPAFPYRRFPPGALTEGGRGKDD